MILQANKQQGDFSLIIISFSKNKHKNKTKN